MNLYQTISYTVWLSCLVRAHCSVFYSMFHNIIIIFVMILLFLNGKRLLSNTIIVEFNIDNNMLIWSEKMIYLSR